MSLGSGAIFLINKEKSAFVLKVQQGLPEKVMGSVYHLELHDQALMQSLLEEGRSLKPAAYFPAFQG